MGHNSLVRGPSHSVIPWTYVSILCSDNTRLGEYRLYVRFLSCWIPSARTILECGFFSYFRQVLLQ